MMGNRRRITRVDSRPQKGSPPAAKPIVKRRFRYIKAALLASTILGAPGLAHADPITLTAIAATAVAAAGPAIGAAIGSAVAGAIIAAALSTAITVAGNLLFAPKLDTASQAATRSREFDPHPPFRFAFGSFPLEGSVVFHYAPDGDGRYYVAYLLNSVPSDRITKIEINDGQDLPFENGGVSVDLSDTNSDIYDMQEGARVSDGTGYGTFDGKARVRMWIGLGEHTQAPQAWLDEIGPAGDNILKTTDVWKGATVVFVTFRKGPDLELQKTWGLGVPPPLTFYGKWAKLYDPRKDPTSGVTGASGTHDRDDRTTWEWSANPSLCALMLVRHDFALGFDDEMIPIQQYADAADAWDNNWAAGSFAPALTNTGAETGDLTGWNGSGGFSVRSVDPLPHAGSFYFYGGSGSTSSSASQDIALSESVWSLVDAGAETVSLTWHQGRFEDHDDRGNITLDFLDGDGVSVGSNAGPGLAAIDAWTERTTGTVTIPTGTRTIRVTMVAERNTGSNNDAYFDELTLTSSIDAVSEAMGGWGCNGLVVIDQRELSLLDPVLACMAGHIDPTDGLLGIRAGTWVAPTDTLSQPIGDEVEIIGARDAGFDTVRAKFIGSHRDWEETDGPGYQLRAGARVHPLQLPLVSNVEQAARLEKIAALRAEPNRVITSVWDGRELNRRIGERVNFSLPGFARAESTFVITAKTPITREVDDGFEIAAGLTLTEDLEATYAWDAGDFTLPGTFDSPVQSSDDLAAPTSVTLEQSDYNSAAGATARLKITVAITQALSERASNLRVETTDGSGYTHLIDIEVSNGTLSYVAYLSPVSVGVNFTARARAESATLGVSAYTTSDPLTIVTPVLDYDSADYNAEFA